MDDNGKSIIPEFAKIEEVVVKMVIHLLVHQLVELVDLVVVAFLVIL